MVTLTLIRIDASEAVYNRFYAMLPAQEQQRADNLQRAEDRRRHVMARAALRMMLGRRLGVTPGAVGLATQARGKPVLDPAVHGAHAQTLHVNVTHAGEWAGIVLAGYPVGIDIEQSRRLDVAALAAQVFDPATCRRMAGHPDPQAFFFKHWTASEARWKAYGVGLAGADRNQATDQNDTQAHVLEFAVAPGYFGAVCVLGLPQSDRPSQIAATTWQAADLLNEFND